MSHFTVVMGLSCLLLVVVSLVMAEAFTREILVDDDSPKSSTNDGPISNQIPGEENTACHMEYQVMKRVVGQCVKLGRTAKGCVAGNYLHPYHPECM